MGEQNLPEAFVLKMKELLGGEAEEFLKSYEAGRQFGLRKNPLKVPGRLPEPFAQLKEIPWTAEGYYYEESLRPGKHPFHEAGCFYIQEPSAMAVAEALKPQPGERILDLCAAPGGKSTHLAGKMGQQGLLVCNEIHPARAKILSQNVERMGIGNAVVTNMEPAGLAKVFAQFFDGIVVDAPCSGEGMFRKDENARGEWSPEHVRRCAERQEGILDCAAGMVKPGGRLVYSTCTFSPEENEQTVARFLKRHPEFSLARPQNAGYFSAGRPQWADGNEELLKTVRIWPHKTEGEGHFLALLLKAGPAGEDKENPEKCAKEQRKNEKEQRKSRRQGGKTEVDAARESFLEFCGEYLSGAERLLEGRRFVAFGENLYLIPEEMPALSGLKVLRPGLQVGTFKKDRLEPAHALALFLQREEGKQCVELGTGIWAEKYLRGETLRLEELQPKEERESPAPEKERKGWCLVTTGGFSLGWAKAAGGSLKNHYPKGLRRP